jgi:hypothetical protein
MSMLTLNLGKVYKVYSGKANYCACGCSGRYHVASQHVAYAGQERGYAYTAQDICNVTVRKIVGRILAAADMEQGENYIAATVGQRRLLAWFNNELD